MKGKTGTSSTATRFLGPVFGALMLAASPGNASSISYVMDQSNTLADGVPYLQVTIADGANGAIDFTVQVLESLSDLAKHNFGIQSFAFNVTPGGDADRGSVDNLPDGWIARNHSRMSEFGFFDIKLFGRGNSRLDTLTFSILGIDGDTVEDYASLSTGRAPGGNSFFTARVAGFKIPDCKKSSNRMHFFPRSYNTNTHGHCPSSAFFADNSSAVPLPGAGWLFATSAAGMLLRARKRRSQIASLN